MNGPQSDAVNHGDGPLLIIAGAGTGKTATLAARCAHLIRAGADPQRLLLLTFSRRAASELAHRCALELTAATGMPRRLTLPWAGTFHAIGARLLRQMAPSLGLRSGFTIADRADAEDLMAQARREIDLDMARRRFPLPRRCLAIYSFCVNAGEPLGTVLPARFPWCADWSGELTQLFARYVDLKQAQGVLDYDDLLLHWATAADDPVLAQACASRFDHVLIDEYQDTNRLQQRIVRALCPSGRGLTVVGDDAQAIYGFRAADVGHILDFAKAFSPPASVITLEQNHRSTPAVLSVSNALLEGMSRWHRKRLWSTRPEGVTPRLVTVADESGQARWVADEVLRQRETGVTLKRQAVLFRASHHAAELELELLRRDIPYVKFGGLRFIESAHVKDLLSLLRLVQNPRGSLAASRALRLVAGVGPGKLRGLLALMSEHPEAPLAALLDHRPPSSWRAAWQDFVAGLKPLADPGAAWPASLDPALNWYLAQLDRLHDDVAPRKADLAHLRRTAARYPSCERFLTELTLDPPQASSDEAGDPRLDEDYLVLSTMHAAKGREWSAVHVLNVVDGCMPADLATASQAELDEERRLLYVAMTRARDTLSLVAPQRFHLTEQARWGDRHVYAAPSRFLTPEVMSCLDQSGDGDQGVQPLPGDGDGLARVDSLAGARRMWR